MNQRHRLTRAVFCLTLVVLGLSGCQSLVATPAATQVRIIDASTGTPTLDIYQGQSALSYNVTFGNVTSYIPVVPGSAEFAASASGSRHALALTHETLSPGQYTLLLGNSETSVDPILLRDQSSPAPAGQVALRFVDQVTAPHAFNLYLVPPGTPASSVSPILINQTLNSISGYLNVPAGSYRIVIYPTGSTPSAVVPSAYSGATVNYLAGSVHTVVLLDQKIPLRPAVQLITATDVEAVARAN